jgi:hypothetical protein
MGGGERRDQNGLFVMSESRRFAKVTLSESFLFRLRIILCRMGMCGECLAW